MAKLHHPGTAVSPPSVIPQSPFDVAVLGAGRVGGSVARALERSGHRVVGELRRGDDPAPVGHASVVVVAVPDDALDDALALVASRMRPEAVVVHTSGLSGLAPLAGCGPNIAAVHPAVPVPAPDTPLDGAIFGVTCPEHLREWCGAFVAALGGTPLFVSEDERPLYHAALAMASNFTVSLAADAAALLGGHRVVVPLLRRTVENIAALGPHSALTGPVVRGDAGTVRAHLAALPGDLVEAYVANARRALAHALSSGRLGAAEGRAVAEALDEARPA